MDGDVVRILITFPGRYGDLLWALPSIRALSVHISQPVDLLTPLAFESIHALLRHQPYLAKVTALDGWEVQDTAPITPREAPLDDKDGYWSSTYDYILHLGYMNWPHPDLLRATYTTLKHAWNAATAEWDVFKGDTPDLSPWKIGRAHV